MDLIAKGHVFCNHLHICVQAFSDAVLKRMNRRYRLEKVYEIASYIGEKLPGCCIGSDLIAGFPGESRQDVDQAIERFLELPISYLHVFPYSERSGTAAVRLDGAVPNEERKRRAARWRAVAERRRADYAAGLVGRRVEIVVERASDGQLTGTTREFVQAAGPITSADRAAADFVGRTISFIGSAYDAEEAILRCE